MGRDHQPVQPVTRLTTATAVFLRPFLVPVLIVVAIVATAFPGSLSAQPQASEADRKKAIAFFEQGEAYFKAGTYDKAIEEYQKAYALVPQPGLLFNIALAFEKDSKAAEAIAAYDRYLAAAPDGVKAVEARARVAALKRDRDEGLAKQATIDGHRQRAEELAAAGKHLESVAELRSLHELTGDAKVLFLIGAAYEEAGEKELASAEYARYLETGDATYATDAARRRRELEKKDVITTPPPGGGAVTPAPSRPSIVWPAAATAVAGGLLVGGILTGLRANSIKSDLEFNLEERDPPLDNSDERFDDGRSAATVANGFIIGAAVVGGVSGYLWWRYLKKSRQSREASTTYVAPTGSGLAIGGTF